MNLDNLENLKNSQNIDIIKFDIEKFSISLRLVDDSDETISLLSKWRDEYCHAFHSKFEVTYEKTKLWIHSFLTDMDKVLFLIYVDNKKVGHIGMCSFDYKSNTALQGYLVKGVRVHACHGLMEKVLLGVTKLMFDYLDLSIIKVGFWSDNFRPINLYLSKLGFYIVKTEEYKKVETIDGWIYEKGNMNFDYYNGERVFFLAEQTRDGFYNLHLNKINQVFFYEK